jgi:Na+-driven multidrug efflux pump
MHSSLRLAIISLRISAIIYWLLGVGCLLAPLFFLLLYALTNELPEDFEEFGPVGGLMLVTSLCWFAALFALAPAIFLEFVIRGLKQTKYWAWVAGIIVSGIYLPSGFVLFGILGLVGLLNQAVSVQFNAARRNHQIGS